ncbi:unnamed protein product, partial [Laminaria digitata]
MNLRKSRFAQHAPQACCALAQHAPQACCALAQHVFRTAQHVSPQAKTSSPKAGAHGTVFHRHPTSKMVKVKNEAVRCDHRTLYMRKKNGFHCFPICIHLVLETPPTVPA